MADESCAGVLAWYSIIHAPMEVLPQIFAEMHRVLRPGGFALLAFQSGNESVKVSRAYGHEVSFTARSVGSRVLSPRCWKSAAICQALQYGSPATGPWNQPRRPILMVRKEAQQHADD